MRLIFVLSTIKALIDTSGSSVSLDRLDGIKLLYWSASEVDWKASFSLMKFFFCVSSS